MLVEFSDWLYNWQSLAGSIIGGLAGVLAAFVVAWSVDRREKKVASMFLMIELMNIKEVNNVLKEVARHQNITDEDYPLWVTEKLNWKRYRLSPVYESYVSTVADVFPEMTIHLNFSKAAYTSIDDHIKRVEQDMSAMKPESNLPPPRPTEHIISDAKMVVAEMERAAASAECAIYFLNYFVLSKGCTPNYFKVLRMRIWRNEMEKKSNKVLHREEPVTG